MFEKYKTKGRFVGGESIFAYRGVSGCYGLENATKYASYFRFETFSVKFRLSSLIIL